MSTLGVLIAVAVTLVLVALGIAAKRISAAWIEFRGQRLVTCPEDSRPAGVVVDANHAALTAWRGSPDVRLAGCSHWPERAGCGQVCLAQIEAAPHDCLVSSILVKWHDGKCCVRCGRPVDEFYWAGGQPALLLSSGVVQEWSEIPAERLPETLEAARPVCFDCYLREVERPRPVRAAVS